jgi:subtilisin family serine protease
VRLKSKFSYCSSSHHIYLLFTHRIKNDANVEWVGEFKPQHKLVEQHVAPQPQLAATVKPRRFKKDLHMESQLIDSLRLGLRSNKKSDWRFSFAHESTGAKYLALNVLLEDSPSQRSLLKTDRFQMVENVMSKIRSVLSQKQVNARKLIAASPNKFVITVLESDVQRAVQELASHHDIHWIEPIAATTSMNKWARWITQTGTKGSEPVSSKLSGSDQIVAIADSGLDYNNCYFYDDKNSVPFTQTVTNPKKSTPHRKIHEYWGLIDNVAEDGAHGTHVAGSVLGSANSIVKDKTLFDEHHGMAPNAKVLFTDIGCTDENGCKCHGVPCVCDITFFEECYPDDSAVYPPLDLNEGLFPYAYQSGARIHTNSWGGGSGFGYGSSSREIDQFTWDHKDFLVLFAAGNSGGDHYYSSLGIEAESKNAIAVGASMNTKDMFKYATLEVDDYDYRAKYFASVAMEELNCDFKACYNFTNEHSSTCAMLKNFTTEADCCSQEGICKPSFSSCGCGLFNAGSFCCRQCSAKKYDYSTADKVYSPENLAYFSSQGPTTDLRIKPDVVAPGYSIISARAHNTQTNPKVCSSNKSFDPKSDIRSMGGTSMATPVTAGNAALVREYYINGYHATGSKDTSKGFTPSAALVKATLINSGRPLQGYLDYFDEYIPIHPKEGEDAIVQFNTKMLEGFGRVTLTDTLHFVDSENQKQSLLLGRKENIRTVEGRTVNEEFGDPEINGGEVHEYCLAIGQQSGNNRVKVTLVWTDYPSTPSRQSHLVNNIDLLLKNTKGDVVFGNGGTNRDILNNVEQIELQTVPSGNYMIRIEGSHIEKGSQPYALIVSGQSVSFRQCGTDEEFFSKQSDNGSVIDGNQSATGYGNIFLVVIFGALLLLSVAVVVQAVFLYVLHKRTRDYSNSNAFKLSDEHELAE